MKKNKIKKILATAMVISTSTTIFPVSQIAMATTTDNSTYVDSLKTEEVVAGNNQSSDTDYYSEQIPDVYGVTTGAAVSTTSAAVYYNDFESGKLPDQLGGVITKDDVSIAEIDGNKVLKINSKFDCGTEWNDKQELSFFTDSSNEIPSSSIIQFDVLIPKANACYEGIIKYSGGIGDKSWAWKSAGTGDIKSSDFEDAGNEYLKKTVSVKINDTSDGLKKVVVQLAGYECKYKGELYIDNIKLLAAQAKPDVVLPSVNDLAWNFDADISGWKYEGAYQYTGPSDNVVNYDSSVGTGSMKLDVDYSNDSTESWSEFKISKTLDQATSFNGYNMLTYDFIYDPSKMTTGGFQTKLFITDSLNTYGSIDLDNAVDVGNGLKKAQVTLKFTSQNVEASSITIGIIGASTNYKGSIYVDNIKLGQEQVQDKYVDKTATTSAQVVVEPDDIKDKMPTTVKLVDSGATESTADLYAYLNGVGKTDYVLYGHQNDTHHKTVLKDSGTNSDTKDITGSIAAISGIDALSLTGAELQLTDEDKANGKDLISKAAQLGIDTANEGGVITLSAHMPNFDLVAKKGKDKVTGKYDYSGYTPGVTTGNVTSRIMPGGDLNEVYNGYLNMIAEYAHKLEAAGVPVIFRPFHENNGSWFWWGKAFCDEEAYKNMYRYTVEYLRDTENVHNFLYVYSPNGPFQDKDDYLSRYPGDEFIDILAFDMYDDNPTADASTDPWMDSFKKTIDLVQGIAKDGRGKLSAVSEVGIRVNGNGLGVSGNVDKKWFSEVSNIVSKSSMPYYMVWANFGETDGFFAPYMVSDTKGHEMINDFIDYYNEDESVFANGVGDYAEAGTREDSAYSYGFITGPNSSSRVLKPTTITASVKGYDQSKFVLKNKAGEIIATLDGTLTYGSYSADITQDILDKIGQTIGSIELYSGDTKLDTISVLFNMKEAAVDPKVVDNFETYSGEDSLLQNTWTTNQGSGCKVTPNLFEDNYNSGKYGLAFNYKIASGGYAGITKSLAVDWSDCDALQFWCKPDGKGQKLVIQVTSNGQDFEVFMPEFSATTEARLVTLKFSDFIPKTKGTALDLANISKMGIWCNTIGSETVDSTMYFDDIKAINTKAPEDTNTGGSSNSNNGSSSNGTSHHHSSSSTTSDTTTTTTTTTTQKVAKNNWVQENGAWKYVDDQGVAVSNVWKEVNGNWYYFNQDSTMKTGWLKDKDNNWYYLEASGAMKTGWVKDNDGNWYYLKSNGAMAKNESIDGYLLGENGAWVEQ